MKNMSDQLRCIKMTEKDIPQVAERLRNAFADKFTGKTGLSEKTVEQLIKLLWLSETEVFGLQPYVLKEHDDVVGTFGLTVRQKKKLTVTFCAKVLAAIKVLGVRQVLAFAKAGLETSRKPHPGELYIDFIAVKESRRNEEIGHQLMEEIAERAAESPGITKQSLYVLKNNEPAKHLYKKYGFRQDNRNDTKKYDFMVKD